MSNFLVDAIGNIKRDYDPYIKESAKTEKLKFTEPKVSNEVRYNTNIPYDKIGKIDSYIDKFESETLKVSDSLSFSEYDEKYKGKEVVSVTEGMSKHATEVYETLKMEHKNLSYSEKDKTLFIENFKKEFKDNENLQRLPDLDEKLGKIYDDVANNIERLPPEYGISMNKAVEDYKEMLNMQTGQDPEAIKNILTMHYNSLLQQLREEKILTGPEIEALQALDQEAINYYNKKYVESKDGEVESIHVDSKSPTEETITTKLNANTREMQSTPTPPRDGFTISKESLLADGNGVNTKFDEGNISGITENLKMNVQTASEESVAKNRVMDYDGETSQLNFNPDTNVESYEQLTHKNDSNDGYQTIELPGRASTYAEATFDRNDTRSNNIYKEYIAMKNGIPENYGEHEKDFWDFYQNLDFSSTSSLITSGASELAKLAFGSSSEEMAEKYENWTNTILERTGVDVMINNSAAGRILSGTAFFADLAAKILQNKDKLSFENYLFATTYLYYLTPIRPDIGASGYNQSGKDWSILGYGSLGNKLGTVTRNIKDSFLSTVKGEKVAVETQDDGQEKYGASRFIREVYDADNVSNNPSVASNVNTERLRKLDFLGQADTGENALSNDNYLYKKDKRLAETSAINPGLFDIKETNGKIPAEEIHTLEISDEILFKGRSVIRSAEDNGFMINNQFNWDIKFEPLFNTMDYKDDPLIENYCRVTSYLNRLERNNDGSSKEVLVESRVNVPNLADYFGPNWLPVTDFNVNFTSNSVSQMQIGTGINIPVFNKVEFPSTLSISLYESNALAVKQWLHDYQKVIYGQESGGRLTRPYQFAATKCSIYLWSVAPLEETATKSGRNLLFNALNSKTSEDFHEWGVFPGILRKYILYVIPINFDLQLNGAGAPSLESRQVNFTIVGCEGSYYMKDSNHASSVDILDPNILDKSIIGHQSNTLDRSYLSQVNRANS